MSEAETVLIVDDDEDLRQLLGLNVKQMGFKVHPAENTLVAREWLGRHVPAFILLDIMMPDGNGLDLCRWIRGQERLAKVPILIASALKDDETVQDAFELGAVDFLHKPFSIKTLREKIERLRRDHSQG